MILTTTPTVEGKEIGQYHGIVVGEAITGANFVKDIFASVRDLVGGRSGAYENELNNARKIAFQELEEDARVGHRCAPIRAFEFNMRGAQ